MASHFRRQTGRARRFSGDPSWAWWYLSRRQKAVLQQQRELGRFGAIPGRAPYWMVQERGEPKAHVRQQRYILRSILELEREQGEIMRRFLAGAAG